MPAHQAVPRASVVKKWPFHRTDCAGTPAARAALGGKPLRRMGQPPLPHPAMGVWIVWRARNAMSRASADS